MAKFLSRLFGSSSSLKGSSLRGSQTSLHDDQTRGPNSASTVRTSSSLENLGSYHVIPRELEKNKLHKASWEGNFNKVKRLTRPGLINLSDEQMRTPIHLAVVKGHVEIVEYLIQQSARLDVVDNEKRTPLIKAVLSGNQNREVNRQICQILLVGGADKYINAVDKHGKNALHYAIDFGNERLVNLFLSNINCDPNCKDRDQMTPLHLAIKRNSPNIVQSLLSDQHEEQADPNIHNRNGQTPLHLAAAVGYIDIVRILLARNLKEPCDPTLVDFQQLTAYQVAKANHQEACAKLIDEYEEKSFQQTPRHPTSTSFTDYPSVKATSSISLVPAANLQHEHDETSDDSSSNTTTKPLKSSPKRVKRSSDQWSDENDPSISLPKPDSHNLAGLMRNNPLQPAVTKTNVSNTGNSTVTNLVNINPLQPNTKKTSKPATSHPSSVFGIGPLVERQDSDNTSTSVSVKKSVIPGHVTSQNKPITSNPPFHPASNTKSWSDDTITATLPKHPQTIKKVSKTDTWDSSSAAQSDDDDTDMIKPKQALSALMQTQPFSPPTQHQSNSESDNDSFETEIRKLDIQKPSTIQTVVNKQIGNGYKVIGPSEVHSPLSEDSSWTSSLPVNKQSTTTNGINTLVKQQPLHSSESTWDDSRPLSADLKQNSNGLYSLVETSMRPVEVSTTGIDNLTKIIQTIMHSNKNRSPSPKVIGKLLVSSMTEHNDSILSGGQHSARTDNDEDHEQKTEEWPVTAGNKNVRQPTRLSLPYDMNSLRGSVSSTTSSFHDARLNELKENIKKIERNQEDSFELKRQLKDMEKQKNEFEILYKKKDESLRDIENKLQQEKSEKQRLELTTKSLNMELKTIKERLQSLEKEKDSLNHRCIQLKEERDNHDEKLRMLQSSSSIQSIPTDTFRDDDVDNIKGRHREKMKLLSTENDDLHNRTKQLQSDLQLHKESLDVTVRYKIDLEKALEEKTFFQHEFDRLKYEKDLIEQEKLEYKLKYDGLQEEIRIILLDRSKLEQKLTGDLHEHMQERQRSSHDIHNYKTQVEHVNTKLSDAEARLLVLQTQNESLLTSKDREIKNEFESLSHRLNSIESEKSNAEQRYHHQHQEITSKQKPPVGHTSTSRNSTAEHQHSPSSSCKKCDALQRSYDQEHTYRLQTEQDNERLRATRSHQKQHHQFSKSSEQQNDSENYLIENSKQIRSDTKRVKDELDRLRQDFDKLVSNYEPTNTFHHQTQLHSQIDIFRQFYEQEFRQRQSLMSNYTSTIKPINHDHSHNGSQPCTACINSRLLKERLGTAIDTSLADERLQTIKQMPTIPRRASSLLTINTTNDGTMSAVELLRQRYHV